MVTSRERVLCALNHEEPDRVPVDLGGSGLTGMHVSVVYRLRQTLDLDAPGMPVKVIEPYQMLGEIGADLGDALGVDVLPLAGKGTIFGFRNEGWKEWTTFDGTPVLVPEGFNTIPEPNGDILLYPGGDRSSPPSGRMPRDGFYCDAIIRQPPITEDTLRVEDNLEEFGPIAEEDLAQLEGEASKLHAGTDKAILTGIGGTAFGDIALVPATWLKNPKGIRDVEEWYVSLAARPEFVREIFRRQCAIALENLPRVYEAIGDRVVAVALTGTDFGAQAGPLIAPRTYCDLFQPFHGKINDWIHANTKWKTFIHSCGSVAALLDHFVEAGFDIINPVQCSAAGMDPADLKRRFGKKLTFWGGGVETQGTLQYGTPEDVRREVAERVRIFSRGGGFIFSTVHNIQPATPVENVLALFEAVTG